MEALRRLYDGRKIIVGRDKLDPTKGVLPKVSVKLPCERAPESAELFAHPASRIRRVSQTIPGLARQSCPCPGHHPGADRLASAGSKDL